MSNFRYFQYSAVLYLQISKNFIEDNFWCSTTNIQTLSEQQNSFSIKDLGYYLWSPYLYVSNISTSALNILSSLLK